MNFLLDTNVCIHLLNNSDDAVVEHFRRSSPEELNLCSIVKAELLYGARKSRRPADNLRQLMHFFAPLVSLPFDDAAAEEYGYLRADLASTGQLIGSNDMMIAAIARHRDLTLVTHNTHEFCRVVGLKLADWHA